jgi:hypothetical protein
MKIPACFVAVALIAGLSGSATGQTATPLQRSAGCAPRASIESPPPTALRIEGVQDTMARSLYGTRDLLVIAGGIADGVSLNQRFFVRRASPKHRLYAGELRAVSTLGWLRVVAVNDTTAIALVEVACGEIARGDYLDPFVEPALPVVADATEPIGELDFPAAGRILFGEDGARMAGIGGFLITDTGSAHGAEPGARYALYRDLRQPGVPLAFLGEATVFFVENDTSVVRVTRARDAVQTGDLLIPRKR